MSSIWGNTVKISIFGESHGPSIGVIIDGVPAGEKIDFEKVQNQMTKRMPGQNKKSSARKEKDTFELISGIFNDTTSGSPICAIIHNEDKNSADYEKNKNLIRPGHVDYTAHLKYDGFNDSKGGGHLSGRLTCPMVFAGSVCSQILKRRGIKIKAKIKFAGEITENDSAGGVIECTITGFPAGMGSPIFDGIENKIASIIFGIPAVKGIEFGSGFSSAFMRGSKHNDEFILENSHIKTKTNNHGGILGGISSGMPIVFRVAFKPTPSISKPQKTINLLNKKEEIIKIKGRHDSCIVLRAVPIVESTAAIALLDIILSEINYKKSEFFEKNKLNKNCYYKV